MGLAYFGKDPYAGPKLTCGSVFSSPPALGAGLVGALDLALTVSVCAALLFYFLSLSLSRCCCSVADWHVRFHSVHQRRNCAYSVQAAATWVADPCDPCIAVLCAFLILRAPRGPIGPHPGVLQQLYSSDTCAGVMMLTIISMQ